MSSFNTKKDVDRYVQDVLSKIHHENEKKLKGYNFARIYYQLKEYESAKRYVASYLSMRDHHAPAHKLMGQIHEAEGDRERALQSYKRSLELDRNQKDLLLKICELYCQIPVDCEAAKYWVERAEKIFHHNSIIFQLREHIISAGNNTGNMREEEMEKLLESELESQPHNVNLRIKLLRLYIDTERFQQAYQYAVEVERKFSFPDSVEWYSTLVEAFEAYSERYSQELDIDFHILNLSSLDCLVTLTLSEPHLSRRRKNKDDPADIPTINDATAALLQFDQSLKLASKMDLQNGAWTYFLDHMRGQLYFHIGSMIMKRAKRDQSDLKEAYKFAAACFLVGYRYKPDDVLQEAWFSRIDEQQKLLFTNFYRLASMRTSFLGHMIISLCKDDRRRWVQNIKEEICSSQVREKAYKKLLSSVNKLFDTSESYFFNDKIFLECSLEFPMLTSLHEYDKSCYLMCSNSLHHLLWLHLHLEQSDSEFTDNCLRQAFKGLKFSSESLCKGSPESLSFLDVEAFLLATIHSTKVYLAMRSAVNSKFDELSLPPDIIDLLCTDEQATWWRSCHGLVNCTIKEKLGEHRLTLQRGLEAIRVIGNHGLDAQLVVHLAKAFAQKASAVPMDLDSSKNRLNDSNRLITDKITSIENRAQFYWNIALAMLGKLEADESLKTPKICMFPWYGKSLTKEEILHLKEEGKLFTAFRNMYSGKLEEAVEIFENVATADASYYAAVTYKKLAMREPAASKIRTAFLNKARNAIYKTMERISGDTIHPSNQEIHTVLDEIERALANNMNRENTNDSENESEKDELDNTANFSYRNDTRNKNENQRLVSHSTPKSLAKFTRNQTNSQRDNKMNSEHLTTVIDLNRSVLDTNKAILEELRSNKEILFELKKQMEELNISMRKQQQQQKTAERKVTPVRTQSVNEDDGFEYDENGILDYYMGNEGIDSYRQGYYGLAQQQQQAMSDVARASLAIVPGLPPGPPSLAPYNYQYPPPHGLPAAATTPLAAQSPGLVVQPPSQPGSLADVQHYYPLNHGLSFSEGQPLPQFRFHVASPVVKPTASTVPQIAQVPVPTPSVTVPNSISTTQVPPATIQPSMTQWTRNAPVPHAFQIPLPATSTAQPVPTTASFGSNAAVASPLPVIHGSSTLASTVTSSQLVSDSQLKALLSTPPAVSTSNAVNSATSLTKTPFFRSPVSEISSAAIKNTTPEANRSRKDSEACSDTDIEREVMGDFKPLIPLPDEVVVKTGEEDEEVLFENRAKLFRFIEREWRERGIGTVKILKDLATGKVRLVMRRDQVHKICANHYVTPTMALNPMKDSEKAFTWAAQDFADETVKLEKFCIRFKNEDIAASFKRSFEEAVEFVKMNEDGKQYVSNTIPAPSAVPCITPASTYKSVEPISVGLAKPGTWACSECYLNNDASKTKCIACEAERSDSFSSTAVKTTKSPFSFSNVSSSTSNSMTLKNFTDKTFTFQSPVIAANETTTKKGFESISSKDLPAKPSVTSRTDASTTSISSTGTPSSVFGSFSFASSETKTENVFKSSSTKEIGVQDQNKVKPASTFSETASPFSSSGAAPRSSSLSVGSGKQVSFGGFTFTSTPVVATQNDTDSVDKEIVTKAKSKENQPPSKSESTKLSPFSGFSFRTPSLTNSFSSLAEKTAAAGDSVTPNSKLPEKSVKQSSDDVFGSKSSVSNLEFSSLSNSGSTFITKTATNSGFPNAGSPLFVTVNKDGRRVSGEMGINSSPTAEEFVPTAEFKPIIPLPPLVEVKTGEEKDKEIFKERAKLFRYENATKEWKECGVGDIKILHMQPENKYRILMRRYQVLKLCANHYILPEMRLLPMPNSEKAWTWSAQDFSQEEMKHENFAVRFRTVEVANAFHSAFETCRKKVEDVVTEHLNGSAIVSQPADSTCEPPRSECKSRDDPCVGLKGSLSDLFKPELGSWECPACYVRNGKTSKICEACDTPRPGMPKTPENKSPSVFTPQSVVPQPASTATTLSSQSTFGSFRFTSPNAAASPESFVFGNKSETSKPFSSGFVFGSKDSSPQLPSQESSSGSIPSSFGFKPELKSTGTPSMFGTFTFGNQTPSSAPAIKSVTAAPSFVFKTPPASASATMSNPTTVFSFGTETTEKTSDVIQFRFGSPQKYEFNFSGVRPHSPSKGPKSPRSPGTPTDAEEEEEVEPSDADGIYFQPVIPLPPKVEVKTGEEDEAVLFSKRAKLFRFTDKEWKERGIGDIKILYSESQNSYRLLMRRDQVLKVCLNHKISKDTALTWKTDKSLIWAAVDYSENEANPEQFAVRFKTAELAAEFKEAVDAVIEKFQDHTSPVVEQPSQVDSSSFSFKLAQSEISQSPDRDSVKKCLNFTNESASPTTEQQKSAKDITGGNKEKFSFFSPSSQNVEVSPFSLSSRLCASPSAQPLGKTSNFFSKSDSEEIEIVYEAMPTPEEVELAEKLMLPKTFFLYKRKPPCKGCRGCENGHLETSKTLVGNEAGDARSRNDEVKNQTSESLIFSNSSVSTCSFADLAAKNSMTFGFEGLKSTSSSSKYVFPGAGVPVFGNVNTSQSNEDDDNEVVQSADVHFEPVIPLPDVVEVKTGEEDEIVLFCSRGKLYRYDNEVSQWKERGIGDMKILKHKDKCQYRLVMRRDQVYKVACNHALTPNIELNPMNTSDTALCWGAVDFSEDRPDNSKFAIRFKMKETLAEFKKVFENSKEAIRLHNSQAAVKDDAVVSSGADFETPKKDVSNSLAYASEHDDTAAATEASVEDTSGETYDPEEDDYEDDEDDDDDDDIVFDKKVIFAVYDEKINDYKNLGSGNLQVLFDDRVYGYRILVTADTDEVLCEHFIAIQTCLRTENLSATWSAIDISLEPCQKRQFKAIFSSQSEVTEFSNVFEMGKKFAVQAEILEKTQDFVPFHS